MLRSNGKSGQGLESDKVALLKWIVERTRCRVVISSTWRKFDHSRERLAKMLTSIGASFAGYTPDLDSSEASGFWVARPRSEEIQAWIVSNPDVTRFVIVDDEADMGNLAAFHVRTDSQEGLTPGLATEIVRRLKSRL